MMDEDRRHRDLTSYWYARDVLKCHPSTLSRFRRGRGKLPAESTQRLLQAHPSPRWRRAVGQMLVEAAAYDSG